MAIIDEIKAAEQRAQKIKDDAKAAARADAEVIETEARKKASDMKEKAKADAAAAESAAEAEAGAEAERTRAECAEKCDAILRNGRLHVEEAAELIFKGACDL